ncbi:MAG: helix-turn-helix domain-containing protein [Sphaerochaetaceae bacterium]|nr:helix-turn-helix domain-containing protein [Sphaerochaetaceae bacterium]
MIGDNIRIARLAHGLSLQDLSERLTASGYPTTKATLSNYETGKYSPNEDVLKAIAGQLYTPLEFFKRDPIIKSNIKFFREPFITDRKRPYLEAYVSTELDRFKFWESLLDIPVNWRPEPPKHYSMNDDEGIERLAEEFREEYGAGTSAIASVCALLENQGWHLFALPDFSEANRNITGYDESTGMPFILYRTFGHQDDMRLALIRSVGLSLIQGQNQKETDALTAHFARAVLLPKKQCVSTFGQKRTRIARSELATGKRLFGLGKGSIMRRMLELGIIEEPLYNEFNAYVYEHFDSTRANGILDESTFYEVPTTWEMRAVRAEAEGLVKSVSMKQYFGTQP